MHVTVLQPLLILAAIAIVGAVPLLGAAGPVASLAGSPSAARGAAGDTRADRASECATRSMARDAQRASCDAGKVRPQVPPASTQLAWAVRVGSCALPPPCA